MKAILLTFLINAIVFIPKLSLRAQNYGLNFASHEVVSDKRTGLDLSPQQTLCFDKNFELSFQLQFLPNHTNYFGYIVRIINDEGKNVDLLYDIHGGQKKFKVVYGDNYPGFSFAIDNDILFNKWSDIRFSFDFEKKVVVFSVDTVSYSQPMGPRSSSCFKFLFGANDYPGHQIKDVPPMKISKIRIIQGSAVTHLWELNENSGTVAAESIKGSHGRANNPLWAKKLQYEWQLVQTIAIDGPVSTAFDADNEILHIIGFDSLLSVNVNSGTTSALAYRSGRRHLLRGNQSVYDSMASKIYTYYIDQKAVNTFDLKSLRWDRSFATDTITDYWHTNKFYSHADSSLYMFGGYGHFIYKNLVQRYHFPTGRWEVLETDGDFYTPRYLAALGGAKNKVYLLGGYGSATGHQTVNPKNLYDLFYFDIRERTFHKIGEIPNLQGDFVLANSLVIDDDSKTFYALTYPNHKYSSELQLIKGSLTTANYELLGNTIPFQFRDIEFFSDLFYCPTSKKFIAVTLHTSDDFVPSENESVINIYSLKSPPLPNVIQGSASNSERSSSSWRVEYYILLICVLIAGVVFYRMRRRAQPIITTENAVSNAQVLTYSEENLLHYQPAKKVKTENAILLFGDLQLYDREGIEITRNFTPLTRELFLIILLHSIRWRRGFNSEKLKELLWFDKPEASARKNMAVNIAKLKNVVDKLDYCKVVKEAGNWRIEIDYDHLYVDYNAYLSIANDKNELTKQKVLDLSTIAGRGSLLSNEEYEWLDTYKSETSYQIVETYLRYADSIAISDDPELLIQIANTIFYFDPISESAMKLKCKVLVYLGNHSLAKTVYEAFCKEYKQLYQEDFKMDFHTVLE